MHRAILKFRLICIPAISFLMAGTGAAAQSNQNFGASLSLEKSDGKKVKSGVFYGGDLVKGVISFDEKKWDGKSKGYCYVFHYTEGEDGLELAFPSAGAANDDNLFPIRNAAGTVQKEIILFEGMISAPYGKDNFVLLITQNPISNYRSFFRQQTMQKAGIVVQEMMKLIKGSKLSEYYRPDYGAMSISTMQIESRPAAEKNGLTKGAAILRTVFVVNDSSEVFYTPKPQPDILRDSFPTIEILDPSFDTIAMRGTKILAGTTAKKILMRGIAVDKAGIRKITVNNQPVTAFKEAVGYFDYLYELQDGMNTTDIKVENKNGYARSIRLRFQYSSPAQPVTAVARDYLLVIGIDSYKGWPQLKNATKDAKDFRELMLKEYGFKKENVIELFDDDATRKKMYATLQALMKDLHPNDRLLVYFSGHGYYDNALDMGYWIPADAHENANDEYLDNLVITRMFDKMKAKNIFVIADACYSGQLLRDMQKESGNNNKSRMVLCSGKLQPVPDGEPGNNSPFAIKVLDYLGKPTSSRLLASDLIQYVKKSFVGANGQQPVGGAIDEVGDENGDFIFERKN